MLPVVPTRRTTGLFVLAAGVMLAALVAGVPIRIVGWATTAVFVGLVAALTMDFLLTRRAWQASPPRLTRTLPDAFAIAVRRDVHLHLDTSDRAWRLMLIDGTDPTVEVMGMPVALNSGASQRLETSYTVIPTCRGNASFAPAQVRARSACGLCELNARIGT